MKFLLLQVVSAITWSATLGALTNINDHTSGLRERSLVNSNEINTGYVTVRFGADDVISDSVRAAFENAAIALSDIITTRLPVGVVPFNVDLSSRSICGFPNSIVLESGTLLSNLVIYARIANIDGPFGTLASAGPCGGPFMTALPNSVTGLSGPTRLVPRLGTMQFDSSDLPRLNSQGTLVSTVLHEMMHVVGFGTRWTRSAVVQGLNTNNPTYTGTNGVDGYQAIGGTGPTVPVANTGGSGTFGGHWRESTFQNELMTGFLSGGSQPFSIMTAQSLRDLGYEVNTASRFISNSYVVPGSGATPRPPTPGGTDMDGDMFFPEGPNPFSPMPTMTGSASQGAQSSLTLNVIILGILFNAWKSLN